MTNTPSSFDSLVEHVKELDDSQFVLRPGNPVLDAQLQKIIDDHDLYFVMQGGSFWEYSKDINEWSRYTKEAMQMAYPMFGMTRDAREKMDRMLELMKDQGRFKKTGVYSFHSQTRDSPYILNYIRTDSWLKPADSAESADYHPAFDKLFDCFGRTAANIRQCIISKYTKPAITLPVFCFYGQSSEPLDVLMTVCDVIFHRAVRTVDVPSILGELDHETVGKVVVLVRDDHIRTEYHYKDLRCLYNSMSRSQLHVSKYRPTFPAHRADNTALYAYWTLDRISFNWFAKLPWTTAGAVTGAEFSQDELTILGDPEHVSRWLRFALNEGIPQKLRPLKHLDLV